MVLSEHIFMEHRLPSVVSYINFYSKNTSGTNKNDYRYQFYIKFYFHKDLSFIQWYNVDQQCNTIPLFVTVSVLKWSISDFGFKPSVCGLNKLRTPRNTLRHWTRPRKAFVCPLSFISDQLPLFFVVVTKYPCTTLVSSRCRANLTSNLSLTNKQTNKRISISILNVDVFSCPWWVRGQKQCTFSDVSGVGCDIDLLGYCITHLTHIQTMFTHENITHPCHCHDLYNVLGL